MGCMSSKQGTSAFVHPGNRRQANKPYSPPANQFSNGQATSHFVSYGGGNALVLKQGGVAQPQIGATAATLGKQPEYIQVTLPAGVSSGQTIQVKAPDGRLNEIIIPQGFGPGSTFTVEFADTSTAQAAQAVPVPPQSRNNNNHDDGFASGFNNNNSNFVPQATPASNTGANDYSYYPTATVDAQPVSNSNYSSQPTTTTDNYTPNYTPYVSN